MKSAQNSLLKDKNKTWWPLYSREHPVLLFLPAPAILAWCPLVYIKLFGYVCLLALYIPEDTKLLCSLLHSLVSPSSSRGHFCGPAAHLHVCCAYDGRILTVVDEADILFTAHRTLSLVFLCSLVDTIWISFSHLDIQFISNLFLPLSPLLVLSVVHFYHEAKKSHLLVSHAHNCNSDTHTPCHSSDWGCFPLK